MHGLMCSTRSTRGAVPAVQPPPPRADSAAADATDRAAARQLLTHAFRDDVLHLTQFELGLEQALRARTVGDIRQALAVVPSGYVAAEQEAQRREAAATAATRRRRGEIHSYARVMTLLVAIWLVVGVSAGAWYPWPIWPALGWGIPLLASGRGRRRDYDLRHGTFTTDPG